MELNLNHHLGLEMVNCYDKYFTHQETKLNSLIDKLSLSNMEIKILSDVMNKLSHAKQKDRKADFTNDQMMKQYIAHIHKNNPTIFEDFIKGFPEHLPPTEPTDPKGRTQVSLEDHLRESLKNIDLSQIKINALTEKQIDVVVQGIDSQIKMHSADLNEHMMQINNHYDERSQMTENARQVLKQSADLLESINRKMVR